jgi:hypothetical protein
VSFPQSGTSRANGIRSGDSVDHECGDQDEHPREGESAVQDGAADVVLDVPDDATEWPPLPEQQEQRQAAGQDFRIFSQASDLSERCRGGAFRGLTFRSDVQC